MKSLTRLYLLFALLLVQSYAFAQKVLVDTQKSYPGIRSIEVEGGWLDVSYDGGSSSSVDVEAYLESENENQDIVFVTIGDVLKISYKRSSQMNSWNSKSKGWIKITAARLGSSRSTVVPPSTPAMELLRGPVNALALTTPFRATH